MSGGGISVVAGAVTITVGEAALVGIIGAAAVSGGSQILQSEGNKNAGKNQEKADNAAKGRSGALEGSKKGIFSNVDESALKDTVREHVFSQKHINGQVINFDMFKDWSARDQGNTIFHQRRLLWN